MKKNKGEKILENIIDPIIPEFRLRDVLQVIIGASILAIPVAFTEETWRLGESLPLLNIFGLLLISVIFIGAFTYYHYYRHTLDKHKKVFVKRVVSTYVFSFIVVSLILTLIQKAPWGIDSALAFKRAVIVAFPASMSAAIADTLR